MNHKRYSKLTHYLSIILVVLALTLQNTAALPQFSGVQPAAAASGQPGISDDWLAQAQEHIRQSEYNISWADQPLIAGAPASYQAPNRAQDLRFYFQESGLQAIRRTETKPTWVWGLYLSGLGRGEQLAAAGQAALNVAGNQVAYHRQALREVYTNSDLGLLQSLQLDSRPGKGLEMLVLRMHITGDLSAHAQVGGGVQFRHNGLAVLSYSNLKAQDANGKILPVEARLEASLDAAGKPVTELELVIGDQQADYPLSIQAVLVGFDPMPVWVDIGAQAGASYGASVATAGDVDRDGYSDILIGIPYYDNTGSDQGAVFLYFGSYYGVHYLPDWIALGISAYDKFGSAVATAGDVNGDDYSDVIIGAPGVWNAGGSNGGEVYVYYGSSSGPGASPNWIEGSPQPNAQYGFSVATAGDVNGDGYSDVIIGAPLYDDEWGTGDPDVGYVEVYHGSASGLASNWTWRTIGSFYSHLGHSVATAGDVNRDGYADVIIGAPHRDTGLEGADSGSAVLFYGSSGGINDSTYLNFRSSEPADNYWLFGYSVSTAGDVNGDGYADIIIGAPNADHYDHDHQKGEAYVFYGGAPMDNIVDWMVETFEDYSNLGCSVATAGDVNGDGYADILIGQKKHDGLGGETDQGRALVWLGGNGGLPGMLKSDNQADWAIEYPPSLSQFGYSVATAGDVNGDGYSDVLVGAPYYQDDGQTKGMAALFYGAAKNLSQTPGWTYGGDYEYINLGYSVASAGDINGDGYADIIAGAPYYDSTYANQGAVFVWHGSAAGLNSWANWWALGDAVEGRFGYSVDSAGDVNGDGYSDIIVGAPNYDSTDYGMVFVWLGSAGGLGDSSNADWEVLGVFINFSVVEMGTAVASAGDVNGDGYGDIVVSAPKSHSQAGTVMVWHGGPAGLGTSFRYPDWHADGADTTWSLGISVAGAGDVNRDGYSDLIVGGANRAAIWHGSISGLKNGPANVSLSSDTGSFGWSVDSAGDVNGDGYSDVIIGSPQFTNNYQYEGAAIVYCGSSSGITFPSCWIDYGHLADAMFGWSVSAAGDVNGDGYSDVIVGAPMVSNSNTYEGRAHVYYGSSYGLISFNGGDWSNESNTDSAYLGWSVSSAGDVNGDGYADVLIGAVGISYARGELQLFYGNGAPGKVWLLRQFKNGCSLPLHNLGSTTPNPGFCMQLTAHDPMGWGKFDVMPEVKRLAQTFDGSSSYSTGYPYSTRTGATWQEWAGVGKDSHYHWRVRIKHSPVTSPFAPPLSRWLHIPWNGWNEADLTTGKYYLYAPLIKR